MAQTKADNRTKADSPSSDNILPGGTLGGRVRVMQDTYTFSGEAIADTVLLFQDLKAGATILDIVIDNTVDSNATIWDIGDSNDAGRYVTGYTAGVVDSSRGAATAALGRLENSGSQYVVGTNAGDEQVILTISVAASADSVAKFTLYYTED